MSRYAQRRKKLRAELKRQGIPAMLVTDELNVTYLSGFSGDSSYLLILPKNTIIISDFRYIQEIEHDCPDINSVIRPSVQSMVEASQNLITKAKVSSVALEGNSLSLGQAEALSG
ncbi:MAG: aminopeptidase P family N-terminal domain-containing protein, partial [Planctomycetota bacterium]|nr:aminopeptidase P family N-terminal domain-containing protein [Planctomycetota bacterium]